MEVLSIEKILKAKSYSDLFNTNREEAKKQFRAYMKKYHPDVDNSEEASKAFRVIMGLYTTNETIHQSATVDEIKVFRNKKTHKGFEISRPVIINNGTCIIYHTATKIVLEYKKDFKKFYEAYISNVKLIRYADDKMREQFERYFPKVSTHFETEDDTYIILLDKTPEVLNLGLIVQSYIRKGEKFPSKQSAWILNRLYNLVTYMHFSNKVFNGFSLSNLWVSPEYHSVLLYGGWEYSTLINEIMIGCPKEVFNILPVKVKDSHKSLTLTDIESIKTIGRTLFNDGEAKNVVEFLKEGTGDIEPIDDWNLYGKALKTDFGKRQFIIWENVPYSK